MFLSTLCLWPFILKGRAGVTWLRYVTWLEEEWIIRGRLICSRSLNAPRLLCSRPGFRFCVHSGLNDAGSDLSMRVSVRDHRGLQLPHHVQLHHPAAELQEHRQHPGGGRLPVSVLCLSPVRLSGARPAVSSLNPNAFHSPWRPEWWRNISTKVRSHFS